ncbi:hypothetical protein [Aquimarina rhabdastrellae]
MKKFDVQHFLGLYQLRLKMQEDRITKSNDDVKQFMKDFIAKLSKMPLDEEVKIIGNSFVNSKGEIIAILPLKKNE